MWHLSRVSHFKLGVLLIWMCLGLMYHLNHSASPISHRTTKWQRVFLKRNAYHLAMLSFGRIHFQLNVLNGPEPKLLVCMLVWDGLICWMVWLGIRHLWTLVIIYSLRILLSHINTIEHQWITPSWWEHANIACFFWIIWFLLFVTMPYLAASTDT